MTQWERSASVWSLERESSSQQNAVPAASSSCTSCSSPTLSTTSQPSKPKKIVSSRWGSSIRVENKVPIDPTPADAVTYHSAGYSHRKRSAYHEGLRRTQQLRPGQSPMSSSSYCSTSASADPGTNSKSHNTVVFYCCNVSVNLKNTEFRDSDSDDLIRYLEQRLFLSSCDNPGSVSNSYQPKDDVLDSSVMLAGSSSPSSLHDHVSSSRTHKDDHRSSSFNDLKSQKKSTYLEAATVPQQDTIYFVSLDLSENLLTCEGIKTLASWFTQHSLFVRLRHLKIYKNSISDAAASAIAHLILVQPSSLEELHLSHNKITDVGAAALFKSFAHAQKPSDAPSSKTTTNRRKQQQRFIYPRYVETVSNRNMTSTPSYLPVWIRLEYNYIMDTMTLLQKWEADCRLIRQYDQHVKLACFADRPSLPRGSKDPHCSPARCLRASGGHSPILHLYSFYHQSTPPSSLGTNSYCQTNSLSRNKHHPNASSKLSSLSLMHESSSLRNASSTHENTAWTTRPSLRSRSVIATKQVTEGHQGSSSSASSHVKSKPESVIETADTCDTQYQTSTTSNQPFSTKEKRRGKGAHKRAVAKAAVDQSSYVSTCTQPNTGKQSSGEGKY